MERTTSHPNKSPFEALSRNSDLLLSAAVLAIFFVIFVPLPTAVLDMLLIANLAASALMLLTAACISRPLELSSFPSMLLVATFFRLALNVASTRLILGNAQAKGLAAAGGVIETFAVFVAGNNLAVGFVVFVIIVTVQFIVITKGTMRISEVAARFTLDAMPGKQLSIDGDLAAGILSEEEARRKRKELSEEAAFYGAMDGASKFVRGEAVAGVLIALANVLGGFFIGTMYFGMEISRAAAVFTRLTLGDGLVTQVPALLVSVATALLVSRGSSRDGLGREMSRQLFANDRVLFGAAIFLLLLLPSGLPKLGLLLGAAICAGLGFSVRRKSSSEEPGSETEEAMPRSNPESPDAKARSLLVLEPIELEIGFRLIGLVDEAQGGDLMARLARVRERVAMDLGLVVPAIKVVDNTRMHPAEYSIKLRTSGLGRWRVRPEKLFVSGDGALPEGLRGTAGIDPVTGKPGIWVDEALGSEVAAAGLRARRAADLIAAHLDSVIRVNAAEVLTREEVSRLISDLRKRAPALVDELIPGVMKLGELQKILQALLREQVSIRDLEAILETLADHGDQTKDTRELTEQARRALSRTICGSLSGRLGIIRSILLDTALEEFLQRAVEKTERGYRLAVEPELAEALTGSIIKTASSHVESAKDPVVLVCSGTLRPHLRDLMAGRSLFLPVVAYEEIPDEFRLEPCGTVALEPEVLGVGQAGSSLRLRR